jgi:hypothetical protein
MASIFSSPTTLRSKYDELTAADIAGTTLGTAKLLTITKNETSMVSIYNGVNATIRLALVNVKDTTQTKQFWIPLEQGQSFNLDAMAGRMLSFPAETKIYVYVESGTCNAGKVRSVIWG